MGHLDGFAPVPCGDFLDLGEVASPNPEDNLFCCYLLRTRPLEERREFTQRTGANIIQGSDFLPKLFVAPRQHLCALKSQFTNDFREKCNFSDVGFNQEYLQVRAKDLEGKTRESAPRTHVGEPTMFQRYGIGRIHTLAKMTIKYLQRVTNGGQVYLFIPGQQNVYILLNLKDLVVIGREFEFSEGTPYHGC